MRWFNLISGAAGGAAFAPPGAAAAKRQTPSLAVAALVCLFCSVNTKLAAHITASNGGTALDAPTCKAMDPRTAVNNTLLASVIRAAEGLNYRVRSSMV